MEYFIHALVVPPELGLLFSDSSRKGTRVTYFHQPLEQTLPTISIPSLPLQPDWRERERIEGKKLLFVPFYAPSWPCVMVRFISVHINKARHNHPYYY